MPSPVLDAALAFYDAIDRDDRRRVLALTDEQVEISRRRAGR